MYLKLEVGSRIHNRFEIEVRDARTGEIKQRGQAENIILNRMYERLCNFNSYFNYIHFGKGEGALDTSRNILFDELGYKQAVTEEIIKDFPISRWVRKIVLNPEEYVGESITEVGISDTYSSSKSSSYINTHALIKDAEGNLLNILKTDTDVVVIYATVFIELQNRSENIYFTNLPNNNALLNYLCGGSAPSGDIEIGRSWHKGTWSTDSKIISKASTKTINAADRKIVYYVRFGVDEGNDGISEIGLKNIFSCKLPETGVFTQNNIINRQIGVGDGVQDTFNIPDKRISDLTIKTDNAISSDYAHSKELSINYNIQSLTDIKYSVINENGNVICSIPDSRPKIYSLNEESATRVLAPEIENNENVKSICISSNGDYIILYKNTSPALVWYKKYENKYINLSQPEIQPQNNANISRMAISDDDMYVALGLSSNPTLFVYKKNNDELIKLPNPEDMPRRYDISTGLSTNYHGIDYLVISPDTKYLACIIPYYPYVYMYKIVGDTLARIEIPEVAKSNGTMEVGNIAFSPDGKYFVASYYNEPYLTLYSADEDGFTKISDHNINSNSTVYGVCFSNDSKYLLMFIYEKPYYKLYEILNDEFIEVIDIGNIITGRQNNISIINDSILKTDQGCYNVERTKSKIKFNSPPAEGAIITADYTVPYIPKTEDYVLDVTCEIQFGEGV